MKRIAAVVAAAFLCAASFIVPAAAQSDTSSAEISKEPPSEEYLLTKAYLQPYSGQSEFSCAGQVHQIPSRLPFYHSGSYENLWLSADKSDCTAESYKVYLEAGPDCDGRHDCLRATFSSVGPISSSLDEIVDRLASGNRKRVEISGTIEGYFVPSQCFAYCNQAMLVWRSADRLYSLSSDGRSDGEYELETTKELVDSANSFISQTRKSVDRPQ